MWRERLSSAINALIAKTLSDKSWTASAAEHAVLREYAALCRQGGDLLSWADTTWLHSVLLERAGKLREAEQAITALQRNQDGARRTVAAWGPKARVTGKYRFLPARLASLRYRLGDGAEAVFDAVEWAKSRALSDVVGDGTAPDFVTLQKGLQREGLHYVTYLLDAAESFAVLATRDGWAEAVQIPVGHDHVRPYASPAKISPAGRAGPTANPLLPAGDWTVALAALAGPLDAALAAGRIAEGDTLLLSPHGLLHLFPLHALPLRVADGRAVGEVMAVARVHGAGHVLRDLQSRPVTRPAGAIVMRAPLREEAADVSYAHSIERCAALLGEGLRVRRLDGPEATAQAALDEVGPDRVLHFCCHGDMLPWGPVDQRSFLLLAHGGGLPERQPFDGRVPEGALTAAAVLARADALATEGAVAPLRGTHVTLQACVSGHAAANPQGDAVGLEWAFLMAGAASVMGTHWHVDRDEAAAFTEAFYRAWLGGAGRVAAWASAGAALRRSRGDGSWAAFSLTGEWR